MQVVLNKDSSGLGRKGDIINVKDGYFRNYLWPQGIADVATKAALDLAEERERARLIEKEKLLERADEIIESLEGAEIKIARKASKKGKLYAGITEMDFIDAMAEQKKVGLDVDFVKMSHFKEVGEHEVEVNLAPGKSCKVKLIVEAGGK